MQIIGKCHCGNISFVLDWKGEPAEIAARACSCSFCRKHGAMWTSNSKSMLEVTVRDPTQSVTYRFGTETAEFHVCSRCGVAPVVTSHIEDHVYAVVNVNTFENVEASLLRQDSANFEGEEADSRLARRTRNWIADVRFRQPDANAYRPATRKVM
jgi:hypothetical protein